MSRTIKSCEFGVVRDLSNQVFGDLIARAHVGFDKWHHALWNCECSCGVMKIVAMQHLTGKSTTSCTHVKKEVAAVLCGRLTKGKFGEAHPMFGRKASLETRAKSSASHTKDFNVSEARRLRAMGWSDRKIAKHMHLGHTTVNRKLGARLLAA